MNKQIIIDGVKTSKKDFIDNFSIELTNRNIFEREQIGDKYFEIILAKEQECEELNKWLPIVTRLEEQFKSHEKAKGIDYKTYAEQVFTELDQLKAENETYKKMLEDEDVQLALTEIRSGERHLWYNKAEKLSQALTEIKEIAYELTNEEYTDFIESKQEQILQKCEVVDDI